MHKNFSKLTAIFLSVVFLGSIFLAGCGDTTRPVSIMDIQTEESLEITPTPESASETNSEPLITQSPLSDMTTETDTTETVLSPMTEPPSPEPDLNIDYEKIKPYEVGQIMIIMYHGVFAEARRDEQYKRSVDDFKNDLKTLYEDGYRLCSMKDLADNNINVEAGFTPVVLTFDDGLEQTFSLVDNNGVLSPRENTGVYILEEFCKQYPDFGRGATFYINDNPFPGDGTVAQRLKWLVDNDYDIGNHTTNHIKMSKANAEEIQSEITYIDKLIKDSVPGYEPVGFSYPFGIRPDESLYQYVLNGGYGGSNYSYKFALREGMSGADSAPNRNKYDILNMPRVCGSSLEIENAYDLGYFLNFYREHPEYKYISDGSPNSICLPQKYEDNVNKDSLGDKQLILY